MDFMTAVRTCLSKYVDFSGRARRSEYWYFFLFGFLVTTLASILDAILGTDFEGTSNGLIGSIASLALFLPSLAVGARRLHDTGRSGWWQLLWFVLIIGWIVLIVWYVTDSKPGENKYGANPKGDQLTQDYPQVPPTGPDYGATGPNYGQ